MEYPIGELGTIKKSPNGRIFIITNQPNSSSPLRINQYEHIIEGHCEPIGYHDHIEIVPKFIRTGQIPDSLCKLVKRKEDGTVYIRVFDLVKELADEQTKANEQKAAMAFKAFVLYSSKTLKS